MSRTMFPSLLLAAASALGCGAAPDAADAGPDATHDDAAPDAPSGARGVVSGVAIYHSMNRLAAQRTGNTPAYSGLTLEVASVDALARGAADALGGAPFDSAACLAMGGCAWSLPDVALPAVTLGLASRLRDGRATPLWVTAATGIASPAEAAAAAASGRFEDGRAFVVSRDAIDAVVAPMVGLTGDEVMARGFVFGLVYDRAGSRAADGSGTPIVGATVTASAPGVRVVYPNNMFSGTVGATASQGAFLAVPSAAGAPVTVTFAVAPPAGQSLAWDATRAAVIAPGLVYFTPMYAR